MIIYGTANTDEDLIKILELQKSNLEIAVDPNQITSEGFVTIQHDLHLLKYLNSPYSHTVARDDNRIVGYALSMVRSAKNEIEVLKSMFDEIDSSSFQNNLLKESDYMVMGQVCIDKEYRGKGLFRDLYRAMAERMKGDFDYIITEVAQRNTRSLSAHYAVGFELLKKVKAETETWEIIILPLK